MKSALVLGVLLGLALATGALASGYSEFNLGIAYAKRDESDQALAHMAAALAAPDLDPALRAPAHFVRAEAFGEKGQWQSVIDETTATLAADPQYLVAYGMRGFVYERMQKFGLAAADFTAVINARPFQTGGYYDRADAYLGEKNFAAAIADGNVIVKLAPDSWSSYDARGTAYRLSGDLAHASDDLNKAIDLSTNMAEPYLQRALLYEAKGDYRRAMDDLDETVKYAPDNMVFALDRGVSSWALGDFPAAAKDFQTVRDSASGEYTPYAALWLAIVKLATGGSDADAAKAATVAIDRGKWPVPILDLYTGASAPDAVSRAAGDDAGHICEANFYSGEWFLLHHNAAAAKPLIDSAAASCPDSFIERDAANAARRDLSP